MTSDPDQAGAAGWTSPTAASGSNESFSWARPTGPAPPAVDEATMRLPRIPAAVTPARREGLLGTLVVLAITALVLIGVAALGLSARARQPPAVAQPALAQPSTPPSSKATPPKVAPTGDPVYLLPGDLCEAADFTNLRPTFDQIGDLNPHQDSTAGFFQFAQCDGTTGNETVHGSFSFRASVYADARVARKEFEAARTAAAAHARVADVAGVGSGAYDYVDPAVGPTAEIYDGNLRIRLSWDATDAKAKAPPGTTKALIDVCKSTMMLLRDN
jgi:hypothetical protein